VVSLGLGAEKGKYKGVEKDGQKTGKDRIRFAHHTTGAV